MSLSLAQYRAGLLQKIRNYFLQQGVLEIETPILSAGISLDAHIDVFSANYFSNGYSANAGEQKFYLQTSPEYHMKRLLCQGFPDIYQMSKVFRNGEKGQRHNPEFTLLEWYRRGYSIDALMDEVAAICFLALGKKEILKKTYQEIFLEYLQVDPLELGKEELLHVAVKSGLNIPAELSLDKTDVLNFLLTHKIEEALPHDALCFVYEYPAEQACLAKLCFHNNKVAERFEVYYKGVELCNGYGELADAREYRRRFQEENIKRKILKKPILPLDENFLEALQLGLPECAGVALGVDRLCMLGGGQNDLKMVLSFPWDIS